MFVLLQGDLYPEADPNKFNIIAGDLAIWKVVYYVCLQYRTVDAGHHRLPTMAWTRIQAKHVATNPTTNIVRSKVNQSLWEWAIKKLTMAQYLCGVEATTAQTTLTIALKDEPIGLRYRCCLLHYLSEFVNIQSN